MSKETIYMNLATDIFKSNLADKKIIFLSEKKDIIMDSQEEIHFLHWLKEAHELGLIEDELTMQVTYDLSESISMTKPNPKSPNKMKSVHLLAKHVYTADFNFTMKTNKESIPILNLYHKDKGIFKKGGIYGNNNLAIVDTKGGHDSNSRATAINQKWVWQNYGLIVTICKMSKDLFYNQYWAPKSMFTTAKGNYSRICQYCVQKEDIKKAMKNDDGILELENKREKLMIEAKANKKTRKKSKSSFKRRFY